MFVTVLSFQPETPLECDETKTTQSVSHYRISTYKTMNPVANQNKIETYIKCEKCGTEFSITHGDLTHVRLFPLMGLKDPHGKGYWQARGLRRNTKNNAGRTK